MPRVPQTPTSSSARARKPYQADKGKVPPFPPKKLACPHPECEWSFDRQNDLRRHGSLHLSEKELEAIKIPCTVAGCSFKTLQRVNLTTHMNTHTGAKPFSCSEPSCSYTAADRSCVYKHENLRHGRELLQKKKTRKPRKPRASRSEPSSSSDSESSSSSSVEIDFVFESFSFSPASSCTSISPSSCSSPLPEPDTPTTASWNWDPTFEVAMMKLSSGELDCTPPVDARYDYLPKHLLPAEGTPHFPFQLNPMAPFGFPDVQLEYPMEPLLFDSVSLGLAQQLAFDGQWFPANPPQFAGEWSDVGMGF
ncbi:hypothetical protein C8F01DRAFT_786598 [Mycena amicta]|nr:hypothetical protein C8F01DRAFT_786598 [Mycena amicta]